MSAVRLNILLAAMLGALCLLSLLIGPLHIDPFTGNAADTAVTWQILLDVRLPRIAAALLSGLALGASGAAMQALLRNPLAEPGVMGVSAGAALAATGVIYFGIAATQPGAVALASMTGALMVTAIIALASKRYPGVATLILIGVALSSLAGAIMALFVNLAPNPFSLSDLINWTAGSVANRDWRDIGLSAPLVGIGIALILTQRRNLTALALGDEAAFGLGVDLSRNRLIVIVGIGMATGGAVAIAGMIGFVGLVAPHMIRAAVRHDPGATIWPAAMVAAILLVAADLGIRLFPYGNELHLGTVSALLGAPIFAWIALRGGAARHG